MMSPVIAVSNRFVELGMLFAFAFFLPLYEAPKNVFWLIYVLMWLWNRVRARNWGGAWDRWDMLIGTWIFSAYIVATFAGIHHDEWRGADDVLRYGILLWCIKRSGYERHEFAQLVTILLAGCAVGLAWGFWRFYVSHERVFVELNSVGHVNHSAPYLAICASLALAWLVAHWKAWGTMWRVLTSLMIAFLIAGVIVGQSRGTIGAMVVVPFVLGIAWWKRSRMPLIVLTVATLALIVFAVVDNIGVVAKQRSGYETGDHLSHRDTIWRRALLGWRMHPWFGTGIDNYGAIPEKEIQAAVENTGAIYRREDYLGANHAHSLYLNTLVERGVFGFSVFATVLAAWIVTLWKRRPRPEEHDDEWALWGASLAAWTVIVLAGLFNTTFHHEIALLAMAVLGSWLSLSSARNSLST